MQRDSQKAPCLAICTSRHASQEGYTYVHINIIYIYGPTTYIYMETKLNICEEILPVI